MKQQTIVAQQFGNTANAYLTSVVHSTGKDLQTLRGITARYASPDVLDLGCGAGHASFAVSPVAGSVKAYDLSQQMLDVVAHAARERGLGNIETHKGLVEALPFADAAFDVVISRFSAHHWADVPAALKEVARVLKPGGAVVFIDVISPESPMHDTVLQTVELLRDVSHVRDYRISEWERMFADAGFAQTQCDTWEIDTVFTVWVERMRTPEERVAAIRSLWGAVSEESLRYFAVREDGSFVIDVALFELRKRE